MEKVSKCKLKELMKASALKCSNSNVCIILFYDLKQILYDHTVEVRNRFKGLDLIECLMNYGQRFVTLYRRQESRPSKKKKCRKAKWLSEEAL